MTTALKKKEILMYCSCGGFTQDHEIVRKKAVVGRFARCKTCGRTLWLLKPPKEVLGRQVWTPPDGATCGKCLEPIAFYKIEEGPGAGKWCVCNPDGTDHWDLCREQQIKKGLKKPGIDFIQGPVKQHGKYPVVRVESPGPPFIVEGWKDEA
jgi:hypothetical protein